MNSKESAGHTGPARVAAGVCGTPAARRQATIPHTYHHHPRSGYIAYHHVQRQGYAARPQVSPWTNAHCSLSSIFTYNQHNVINLVTNNERSKSWDIAEVQRLGHKLVSLILLSQGSELFIDLLEIGLGGFSDSCTYGQVSAADVARSARECHKFW